jgi:octaprenyl-diphosphate synthase
LEDYLEMLDMKTGELFSISTYLGGLLSGYPDKECDTLKRFGSELGIAYQAYDDLTDFIGDESIIGKTLGTDLVTGKATLPLIQLFQLKNEAITSQMTQALSAGNGQKVRDLLETHGIYGAGIQFVSELWNKAVATLEELPDSSPAKHNLAAISQLLREKLNELEQSRISA